MRLGKTRWLPALTLALALAAPEVALGEVARKSAAADREQGAPPPIQVIRRTSVGGAYPVDVSTKAVNQKRGADKSKTGSSYRRSAPVRSAPVCSTPSRSTMTGPASTAVRSIPILLGSGRG